MELGIAGVPRDVADVETLCRRLGVAPVFLLAPGESSLRAGDLPVHLLHVASRAPEAYLDLLRGRRLAGLWAASRDLRGVVAAVAARLNLPHMACPGEVASIFSRIQGARQLDLAELDRLSEAERQQIPLPVWVRASCGNGDSSCMRLDHASDLSLATEKIRKRGVAGTVRLQPVLEGAIFRLLAFKTGRSLVPFDIVSEETTTSMFRVPLSVAMPVPRRGALFGQMIDEARRLNQLLPKGWGYLEMEFIDAGKGPRLVDVQCPASLDPLLREVVYRSQGVDLQYAALQCAVGRAPLLTPVREVGVASTWLLTRSGVVTGFRGVEEARTMPGIASVDIKVKEGDELSHVVDLSSRERGGYIIATGATAAVARARLEAAREQVWINTSPVKA